MHGLHVWSGNNLVARHWHSLAPCLPGYNLSFLPHILLLLTESSNKPNWMLMVPMNLLFQVSKSEGAGTTADHVSFITQLSMAAKEERVELTVTQREIKCSLRNPSLPCAAIIVVLQYITTEDNLQAFLLVIPPFAYNVE